MVSDTISSNWLNMVLSRMLKAAAELRMTKANSPQGPSSNELSRAAA